MFKLNINKLNLFSGLANREFAGVNFSGNNLKISHIRKFPNRKEVVNLLNFDITGLSDIDISKTIQTFIGGLKGKKVDIIDIIPAHLVITKNIEIPSIDHRDRKSVV